MLMLLNQVYRYGQKKQVHIYRFLVADSMEMKVYYRNILKESLAKYDRTLSGQMVE